MAFIRSFIVHRVRVVVVNKIKQQKQKEKFTIQQILSFGNMFRARMIRTGVLKNVFEAIKAFVDDATFECTADGIQVGSNCTVLPIFI